MDKRREAVNHPVHYGGDTPYEVIKVLEAWGLDKSFCLGNAVKYIARYDKKRQPVEDLKKLYGISTGRSVNWSAKRGNG